MLRLLFLRLLLRLCYVEVVILEVVVNYVVVVVVWRNTTMLLIQGPKKTKKQENK